MNFAKKANLAAGLWKDMQIPQTYNKFYGWKMLNSTIIRISLPVFVLPTMYDDTFWLRSSLSFKI